MQTTVATLPGGASFRGIEKDGVRIFRGITFGRYERLKESVEVIPAGEIDATRPGCVCPQRSVRLAGMPEEDGSVCTMEEGRLCLSVYAPSAVPDDGAKLPVMVWIHGGSFECGGSEEPRYSCERLVKTGGVVVAKISYRLGALGYLYMPKRGVVNLGLKDQKLALTWIHHNIAAFGGDSDNLTVFGQSAGAQSIAALMATSKGNPGFSKAILQSAPLGIHMRPVEALNITRVFLKKLGKDVYTASIEEILNAQESVHVKAGLNFAPVLLDIAFLPAPIGLSGPFAGMKVVLGHNAQDASPFVKKPLGPLFSTSFGRTVDALVTESIFTAAERVYAARLVCRGVEVSRYCISWSPMGNPMGACHCIELPFLLGEEPDWQSASMLDGMTEKEFQVNSNVMLKAWTRFASTGEFLFKDLPDTF